MKPYVIMLVSLLSGLGSAAQAQEDCLCVEEGASGYKGRWSSSNSNFPAQNYVVRRIRKGEKTAFWYPESGGDKPTWAVFSVGSKSPLAMCEGGDNAEVLHCKGYGSALIADISREHRRFQILWFGGYIWSKPDETPFVLPSYVVGRCTPI